MQTLQSTLTVLSTKHGREKVLAASKVLDAKKEIAAVLLKHKVELVAGQEELIMKISIGDVDFSTKFKSFGDVS